uniref:Uncharacterized protein n=1 Tax=Odontella aurita TaxID=265563 RepID=A0A7S4J1W2_9STRA|mmetsp:Transcript_36062/g.107847  ORF Transcript_36062/g.107847 Transcript_36062/m.107847 type:complete len:393 (+) Transcript_36062:425-1603(+)
MTRPSILLRLSALASLGACSSATAIDEAAAAMASHSISIEHLNEIYTSEVSADFGDSEKLWATNTLWQWKKILGEISSAIRYSNYHSYLGCYNETGLSGNQRRQVLDNLFTPYDGKIFISERTVINIDQRSCYLMSAELGVFRECLENAPQNVTEHFELQPAGPSMKMLEGFYDAITRRLLGEDVQVSTDKGTINITQDEDMVIDLTFCPVINYLIGDTTKPEVTFKSLAREATDFMVDDSGVHVKDRDFFYQAYNNSLTDEKPSRMKQWHDVVVNVTSRTDDQGYNRCLNYTIQESMVLTQTMGGMAQVSFPRDETVGREDEECIFYLVRAMANHPYLCRMDLKGKVKTNDDDEDKNQPKMEGSGAPWSKGAYGASALVSVAAGLALNVLL